MKMKRIIRKINQLKSSTFHLKPDGGVVFLLLLFCPYIFTMYMSKDVQDYQTIGETDKEKAYVLVEHEMGNMEIELEEYVKGILPSVVPMEYETATFQVQAILLRTLYEKGTLGEYCYLTKEERSEYFGNRMAEYEAKIEEAVSSTTGMYLASAGKPIEAAFCLVSAGKTRSGAEVLGEEYAYLTSVSCLEDYQAPEYQQAIDMEKEVFYEALNMEMPKEETALPELITDSAGYVLWVVIGDEYLNGEQCAKALDLPSSNFTWSIENEKVHITCKGVGHGFGCSQYSANELAKSGKNYEEILHHFFTNVTIEKIE